MGRGGDDLPAAVKDDIAASAPKISAVLEEISKTLTIEWTMDPPIDYEAIYAALPETVAKAQLGSTILGYFTALGKRINEWGTDELFRETLNLQAAKHTFRFELGQTSDRFPETKYSEVFVADESSLLILVPAAEFGNNVDDCGSRLEHYL